MVGALFVLPVLLVSFGTWIFWPVRPKVGDTPKTETGVWNKLGRGVSKRPVAVAIIGFVILGGLAFGGSNVKIGLSKTEQFLQEPEAVTGQLYLADAFPAGTTTPSTVIANSDMADEVVKAAADVEGVSSAEVATNNAGEAISNGTITKTELSVEFKAWYEATYGRGGPNIKEVQAHMDKKFKKCNTRKVWLGAKIAYERDTRNQYIDDDDVADVNL
jgi:uncharacterized membrane protein YdfJ with MMPL/SSD domain